MTRHPDCHCPRADHRHGKRKTYEIHRCRCDLCVRVNNEYTRDLQRKLRKARGAIPKPPPWTDEEIAMVKDNPHLTAQQAAKLVGRSVAAVTNARHRLMPDTDFQNRWSEQEIATVRDNPHWTKEQVAARLDRSAESVAHIRIKLIKEEGLSFNMDKSPYSVGDRPLVAMTCGACGLLLDSTWFYFHAGWWRTCNRCLPPSSHRPGPEARVANNAKVRAKNLQTRQIATRHNTEWTDSDYAILFNPELSTMEKCLLMSRTYSSVRGKASLNGATSRDERWRGEQIEFWSVTLADMVTQ